jgi:hypothetical protein
MALSFYVIDTHFAVTGLNVAQVNGRLELGGHAANVGGPGSLEQERFARMLAFGPLLGPAFECVVGNDGSARPRLGLGRP